MLAGEWRLTTAEAARSDTPTLQVLAVAISHNQTGDRLFYVPLERGRGLEEVEIGQDQTC